MGKELKKHGIYPTTFFPGSGLLIVMGRTKSV